MMANSPLGLMQLQHKSEDTKSMNFSDFVSNVADSVPLSTALSVGGNTMHSPMNNNPVNAGGGGPIKRKRGRPRKYTLGPFPSASSMKMSNGPNQSVGDRSRLSLPSQYASSIDTFSSGSDGYAGLPLSVQLSTATDSLIKSVKQVKAKMSQKMAYPSMVPMPTTNGHSSISEKNIGSDHQPTTSVATTSLNTLTALSQIDTHSSSNSNMPVSSSMFRYPAMPSVPTLSSTHEHNSSPTKSYNHVQAHQNHGLTNMYAQSRNASLSANNNTSLPFFIDPFFQQTVASVSASVSAATSSSTSINMETHLVGRLLPQAEAAICAAKAAGLSGPHTWTPEMVAAFILTLPGCQGLSQVFIEHVSDRLINCYSIILSPSRI